jgi:hypothetical protein
MDAIFFAVVFLDIFQLQGSYLSTGFKSSAVLDTVHMALFLSVPFHAHATAMH